MSEPSEVPVRDGPGIGRVPPVKSAVLRDLDSCEPRYEGGSPNATNGGRTAFSGWYVPHWLMLRVRAALVADYSDD